MIKYILHPGYITSNHDGQMHFISASALSALYEVNMNECYVYDLDRPETHKGFYNKPEYIHLYPDYHGDYDLITILESR